jgi:hypothetical protein
MKVQPMDLPESTRPEFEKATFIAIVDAIRRLRNGAAAITFIVEPQYVETMFPLWDANNIVSVIVKAWEPEDDDYL